MVRKRRTTTRSYKCGVKMPKGLRAVVLMQKRHRGLSTLEAWKAHAEKPRRRRR